MVKVVKGIGLLPLLWIFLLMIIACVIFLLTMRTTLLLIIIYLSKIDTKTFDMQHQSSLTFPFALSNCSLIKISMTFSQYPGLSSNVSMCTDNIQNQDETDVDCGGLQCTRRCNINKKCLIHSDCDKATCVMNSCLGPSATISAVCEMIKYRISSTSQLFYPFDAGYNATILRYGASSVIPSICSVEPSTAEDVSIVLKLIGQYLVPFGVKGGGHSLNPGFSSTTGIQISMTRLRKLTYHSNNQTVDIGAGLLWGEVYAGLQSQKVTVIGGRVATVGVAGLILGGGYSWKSNRYGLSIDNVLEYQLVAPNGTIVNVNNNSYPDIFFGLKGGLNNFGIVTNFNMRAIPQTRVYGGILIYTSSQFKALIPALVNFMAKTDPKAQITGSFVIAPGQYLFVLVAFYDAPRAPEGTFDEFLAISPIGLLKTQSYLSLIKSVPAELTANLRSRYATFSVTNITAELLNGMINRILHVNSTLCSKLDAYLIFDITPFTPSVYQHSQGGAYPHTPSPTPLVPLLIQFSWALPSDDQKFLNEIRLTRDALLQIALDEGQDIAGSKQLLYSNYALDDTPVSQLYGDNLARLQRIRQVWDPENVMYLTGGFKL